MSDTIHINIQKNTSNWCKSRNMFGQYPRRFSITQVYGPTRQAHDDARRSYDYSRPM